MKALGFMLYFQPDLGQLDPQIIYKLSTRMAKEICNLIKLLISDRLVEWQISKKVKKIQNGD
ncbi:unnamed protein product [Lupinus luteus]|uniref:Uncharacterized protein n=1 Tax=Lupinus luteus TaxID=3873 RepID=A0AAV1W726_LUPLU